MITTTTTQRLVSSGCDKDEMEAQQPSSVVGTGTVTKETSGSSLVEARDTADDAMTDVAAPSTLNVVDDGKRWEPVEVDRAKYVVPPGKWRVASNHCDRARLLFVRFASYRDVKTPGAMQRSEYHRKYGNPRLPGAPRGLLSAGAVKRRRIHQGTTFDEESSSSRKTKVHTTSLELVSKQATKVHTTSTRLEWQIDHFEKRMKLIKNGQNLISSQFGAQKDYFTKLIRMCTTGEDLITGECGSPFATNASWELHVYPNGRREEDVNNVSFFLRQVGLQRGEDSIRTDFHIYALDAANNRVSVCRDTKDFTHQRDRGKFQVTREKMISALKPDGSLLLICEVEYLPPGRTISAERRVPERREPERVEIDLGELLDSELFADCCIQVGNRLLKAHRCILGLHSQVFRQMFLNEAMLEAQNGIIDITDSYTEPVQAMLEFMYTGATNEIEHYPESILEIAEKYEVLALKDQCERRLSKTLTVMNVSYVVMFADTYNAQVLKQACIGFLTQQHKDVLKTAGWKNLKKERGDLANELLRCFSP